MRYVKLSDWQEEQRKRQRELFWDDVLIWLLRGTIGIVLVSLAVNIVRWML